MSSRGSATVDRIDSYGELSRLRQRIVECDVIDESNRLIPLDADDGQGGGKQAHFDHSNPENRLDIDEGVPTQGGATYGVYAGSGLVILDVDEPDSDAFATAETHLPETFTVASPHGGRHLYYAVDDSGALVKQFEAAFGAANPTPSYGDTRAENGYCLGPGSQLDGCDKAWCDKCSTPTGGRYEITTDRPITSIDPETLVKAVDIGRSDDASADEADEVDIPDRSTQAPTSLNDGIDVDRRLDHALEMDETFCALWEGRYTDAGHRGDRSTAEWALVGKLAFYFEKDDGVVRDLMDQSCRKTPRTASGEPRKWAERDDGYRDKTMRAVQHQGEIYDGRGDRNTAPVPEQPSDVETVEISVDEAREQCTEILIEAFEDERSVLLEALPTLGKSYGAVVAAATTETPITILTERVELYGQVETWCDEQGLRADRLPAAHRNCPTFEGAYGEEWSDRIEALYETGLAATTLHSRASELFGTELPCERDNNCPCGSDRDERVDWDADVLVGHFTHANMEAATEDRIVVFDEFPSNAFDVKLDENLDRAVSQFLNSIEVGPDSRPALRVADEETTREVLAQASEAIVDDNYWESVVDAAIDSTTTSVYAPHAVYTMFDDWTAVNGYFRVELPQGDVGFFDESAGVVHLRQTPAMEDARAVIALDGTPVPSQWESVLDVDLDHERVLSDVERRGYVDAMDWQFVQTTENVYPYSGMGNADPERDGALIDGIEAHHGTRPAVITTAKAERRHVQQEVLAPEEDQYEHFGNLKSSNQFEETRLGVVIGSRHFGDDYIEREAAFVGESVEPDHSGGSADYGNEVGNDLLWGMREAETLQAAMRFGRDRDGATVYIHTSAIPEWVPRTMALGGVRTRSEGEQRIIRRLQASDETSWTAGELASRKGIDLVQKSIRRILNDLVEEGFLDKESGRPNVYHDTGIADAELQAAVNLPETTDS